MVVGMLVAFSMAGTMKDPRDGKTYKTVEIGNQVWMAENMNYKTSDSWCYDNEESNCKKYGRLYTWQAAMNACPDGWHLPGRDEFKSLLDTVGTLESERSLNLRAESWEKGSDKYGFSDLPAGAFINNPKKLEKYEKYKKHFSGLGSETMFWSSKNSSNTAAYELTIRSRFNGGADVSHILNVYGLSVRCLQN